MDTGASYHMTDPSMIRNRRKRIVKPSVARQVITAQGTATMDKEAVSWLPSLKQSLLVKLLKGCPSALSIGRLVIENGCSFRWLKRKRPVLTVPDGT